MLLFRLKIRFKSIFISNKGKYTALYKKCLKIDSRALENIDKKKAGISGFMFYENILK